jgi:hypothetical protein
MTTMSLALNDTGGADSFETGFLDGEIAAETGLSSQRATAIADMAEDHDPMYAIGYCEGFWARYAVLVVITHVAAKDETATYLADRDGTDTLVAAL